MLARTAAAAALGLAFAAAPQALAGDVTDDRKDLKQEVRELRAELAELKEQVRGGYANGYSSELEAQIAELVEVSKIESDGLFMYWKTGIRFDSADKRFKFKFGGRIMDDFIWWSSDRDTEEAVDDQLTTGKEFRRARLYVAGTVYGNVGFKAQYDFAGGDADFKDVYMTLKVGSGKLYVGNAHVPFGFEERVSSKYITFMERSLAVFTSPSRNNGFKYEGMKGETWYGFGIYRESDGYGDDTDNTGEGEWNYAARVSHRPHVDDENDQYLNVGGSIAYMNFDDEDVRFRQRPEVHLSPRFVDTGTFAAKTGHSIGLDSAFVSGPFHVYGEWTQTDVDSKAMSDLQFHAHSITAGYFLTGESRPWKSGYFTRVKPKSNYDGEGGTGAWEIAFRYSGIDLNDDMVRGGEMDVMTLGLNWYLNPNTRVMLNYVMIDLDRDEADDVDALMIRFQIDF